MTQLFDSRIGAEDLQLAVFKTIHAHIADYIADEETRALMLDAQIATAAGRDPMNVSLEPFRPEFIHYGHRPSMIEAPIEEYPSMSIMSYLATPAAVNLSVDYGHSISLRVAIEMIVKSGPYGQDDRSGVGEDIVGRRIKRTAEAVHRLMQDNAALDGTFLPPDVPPTVTFGEIFEREEDGVAVLGARWYWQGVRMEYMYYKQTVFGQD